jgi:serine/threonine protein kinase
MKQSASFVKDSAGMWGMGGDDQNREALLRLIERRTLLDGRFTNIRRLGPMGGSGNFSLLFVSEDSVTGTNVALKFYNPHHHGDQYRLESFKREAALLQELNGQKDIVKLAAPLSEFVETFSILNGIPFELRFAYYALALARSDVGEMVAAGGWGAECNLIAFRIMCRAIQRIHTLKVAHRDLKPGNFLVMADGSIKMCDLGTARRIDGVTDPLSRSYWAPPGDLRYCAPELLALLHDGDPSAAFRADIYSLGAILFELFSGTVLANHLFERTFAVDLMAIMRAVKPGDRRRVYEASISAIASKYRLPSLAAFGDAAPHCIRDRLDELYMLMAELDYRRRLCDFSRIFSKINTCLLILRNQHKYIKWHEEKRRRRLLAQSKSHKSE